MGMGYLILAGAIMLFSWLVSSRLKSKFEHYSKLQLQNGLSGKEIAERMLADNGIMLGNATVNDQATKNGQDGASRKPQGGAQSPGLEGATELASIQETHISGISRHNGMVDTFA